MSRLSVSYQYEMKKLLLVRGGWIFLTCIIALQIGLACIVKPSDYYTFDKKLYAEYTAIYGGEYSEKTEQAIAYEIDEQSQMTFEQNTTLLHTAQEIEACNTRVMLANMKLAALNELKTKYDSISTCSSMKPELTYDLELIEYIRKFGVNWASIIGIMFLIPMLMCGDANCGMEQILFPTATGKKIIIQAKLLTAATISVSLTTICSILQWIIMSSHWNFGELSIPVQSISGFQGCSIHASIFTCMLVCFIVRILTAVFLSLLIGFLSILTRNEIAIISIIAILTVISSFLSDKSKFLSLCSMYSGLSGINAIKTYSLIDFLCLITIITLKIVLLWRIIHIRAQLDNR